MNDLALFTKTVEELKVQIDALSNRYTQSQEHLVKSILDAFGGRLDIVINKIDVVAAASSGMSDLANIAKKLADNLDKLEKVMPRAEIEKNFAAIHEAVEQLGDKNDMKTILETVEDALQQTRQLVADIQGALVKPANKPAGAAGGMKAPIAISIGLIGGLAIAAVVVFWGPASLTRPIVQSGLTLEERWGPTLIHKTDGMECVTKALSAQTTATCSVKVAGTGAAR